MNRYPTFKKILEIRATRRQRYFKKLKIQSSQWSNLKFMSALHNLKDNKLVQKKLTLKPVRLTQDSMPYELLMMQKNFSEDELSTQFSLQKAHKESLNTKRDLLHIKRLEN